MITNTPSKYKWERETKKKKATTMKKIFKYFLKGLKFVQSYPNLKWVEIFPPSSRTQPTSLPSQFRFQFENSELFSFSFKWKWMKWTTNDDNQTSNHPSQPNKKKEIFFFLEKMKMKRKRTQIENILYFRTSHQFIPFFSSSPIYSRIISLLSRLTHIDLIRDEYGCRRVCLVIEWKRWKTSKSWGER